MAQRKPTKSKKLTPEKLTTDSSVVIDAGGGSEETMPGYLKGANMMPDLRGTGGKQWYDYPDPYKPRKPVRPPVITRYIPPGLPTFPKKPKKPKKPGFGGTGSSEDQGVS